MGVSCIVVCIAPRTWMPTSTIVTCSAMISKQESRGKVWETWTLLVILFQAKVVSLCVLIVLRAG